MKNKINGTSPTLYFSHPYNVKINAAKLSQFLYLYIINTQTQDLGCFEAINNSLGQKKCPETPRSNSQVAKILEFASNSTNPKLKVNPQQGKYQRIQAPKYQNNGRPQTVTPLRNSTRRAQKLCLHKARQKCLFNSCTVNCIPYTIVACNIRHNKPS